MAKIATDIEQSTRLAKILPLDTADMYYPCYDETFVVDKRNGEFDGGYDCLAWSLTALIDLLPGCVFDGKGNSFGLNMQKGYVEYDNPSMSSLYARYYSTGADTLLDAVVDALCWLVDNGHLKLTK